MLNKVLFTFIVMLFGFTGCAQTPDSLIVEIDSMSVDSTDIPIAPNVLVNAAVLKPFFTKLQRLEQDKTGQINIVHIGDSHIQADLYSGVVRSGFQQAFGNAGRGLLFPHNLARTNGQFDVRFSSNETWQSYRNISPVVGNPVGLSGIALFTKSDDFAIEINIKSEENYFNTLKLITPQNKNMFELATSKKIIKLESTKPKTVIHRIRNGEALSIIADKYNVSLAALKKANRLTSNNIRAGRTLKIPSSQTEKRIIERSEFVNFPLETAANYHYYKTDEALGKIYLLPNKEERDFALNGIVLENNNPGVLYHNIGVNGAKFSDYNKYPVFFEQLKALQPDLIILSLGTNESFDKMIVEQYMGQLDLFIKSLKDNDIKAEIIISTPPVSLFQRKYPNVFCADYAKNILDGAVKKQYAAWDLYTQLGGLYGAQRLSEKGLLGSDKVHYTKQGYEKQGNLLFQAIMDAYSNYKLTKVN